MVLTYGLIEVGSKAFFCCEMLKTIELPDSLEIIGEDCFAYSALEEVAIPENVSSIGEGALYCENLATITVDTDNQNFVAVDNILYTKDKKLLIRCGSGNTTVDISSETTRIGKYAFAQVDVETVSFPEGLKEIGQKKEKE